MAVREHGIDGVGSGARRLPRARRHDQRDPDRRARCSTASSASRGSGSSAGGPADPRTRVASAYARGSHRQDRRPEPEAPEAGAAARRPRPPAALGRGEHARAARLRRDVPGGQRRSSARRFVREQRWFGAARGVGDGLEADRAGTGDEEFFKGLSQMGAGYVHLRRGNAHGAVTLLRRAARRVGGYPDGHRGVADAGALGAAAMPTPPRSTAGRSIPGPDATVAPVPV